MEILYGGPFNPPTIAHLQIILYLLNKYKRSKVILLPTNKMYSREHLIDYHHRLQMLKILGQSINNKHLIISNFEGQESIISSPTATLNALNHPYFVIGADTFSRIDTWIDYAELIKNNKFIVFPRNNIDVISIIDKNRILAQYRSHFLIVNDFKEINVSSSDFRRTKNRNIVTKEIYEYIRINHLYEVE